MATRSNPHSYRRDRYDPEFYVPPPAPLAPPLPQGQPGYGIDVSFPNAQAYLDEGGGSYTYPAGPPLSQGSRQAPPQQQQTRSPLAMPQRPDQSSDFNFMAHAVTPFLFGLGGNPGAGLASVGQYERQRQGQQQAAYEKNMAEWSSQVVRSADPDNPADMEKKAMDLVAAGEVEKADRLLKQADDLYDRTTIKKSTEFNDDKSIRENAKNTVIAFATVKQIIEAAPGGVDGVNAVDAVAIMTTFGTQIAKGVLSNQEYDRQANLGKDGQTMLLEFFGFDQTTPKPKVLQAAYQYLRLQAELSHSILNQQSIKYGTKNSLENVGRAERKPYESIDLRGLAEKAADAATADPEKYGLGANPLQQ